MGPLFIGTGDESFADDGAGLFGLTFEPPIQLYVPDGYESGTPLAAASLYEGETFGSLGLELGEYLWTWGSGDTADSFRLNVVPEPGTVALLGLGLTSLGVVGRSRRRATHETA